MLKLEYSGSESLPSIIIKNTYEANDTMQIAELILEVVIVILGLYLAFFKSYFTEKGKNLATQEDIGKIQREIETVKSELHIVTQSKLNLILEERNSLIDAFATYNDWLSRIVDINYCNPPFRFENDERESFSRRSNCYRSLSKLRLFCKHEALVHSFGELSKKTTHYEGEIMAIAYEATYTSLSDPKREEKLKSCKTRGDAILKSLSKELGNEYNSIIEVAKTHLKTLANGSNQG